MRSSATTSPSICDGDDVPIHDPLETFDRRAGLGKLRLEVALRLVYRSVYSTCRRVVIGHPWLAPSGAEHLRPGSHEHRA
jgi:hypothetical protein